MRFFPALCAGAPPFKDVDCVHCHVSMTAIAWPKLSVEDKFCGFLCRDCYRAWEEAGRKAP